MWDGDTLKITTMLSTKNITLALLEIVHLRVADEIEINFLFISKKEQSQQWAAVERKCFS